MGVDRRNEAILFDLFRELAQDGKVVMVVNHDLGESITHFDDLVLLNRQLVAAGDRAAVLNDLNLQRAYGSRVKFFQEAA